MIKKIFYLVALFFLLTGNSFASHYQGGEIWWVCMPDGKYRFHARCYMECGANFVDFPYTYITINTTVPGLPSFQATFVDTNDITPKCFPGPPPLFQHLSCATAVLPNTGGVLEFIYQSAPLTLPAGPPPATGWVFSYRDCCRNPCQNIAGADGLYWYLRAIMYPYPDATYNNCWDNSPRFVEKPSTVICTGYPFSYNPNAYDIELDSLVYAWAQPWTDNNMPIPAGSYLGGTSWDSPLPGPGLNPLNIPATVNPNTGEISFTSHTQGGYVTVNKVTAFRCGVKIAEIFRDMQIVLLNCPGNNPPLVIIQYPNGDTLNNYTDTVFAGAVVKYDMWAYDGEMLNDTLTPQNIIVTATGSQLGNQGISTTTGCLNPPCAQLYWGDSISPYPLPAVGVWALNTTFRWHTDCSHLATETGCGGVSNVYNFVIRTADDYCPAPAIKWTTITIVVKNAIQPPPSPRCITTEPSGAVKLQWVIPDTTEIPNTWNAYLVFRSKNINGPYTLIDSLKAPAYTFYSTAYTDLTAHGNDTVYYYYMQTRSGCYGNYFSAFSDTINNILLNVSNTGGGNSHSVWNAPRVPLLPTSSGSYNIYWKTGNTWTLLDVTTTLQDDSPVTGCGFIKFRVGITDSVGCESLSNIDSALFQAATPPDLRCVAVEPNGSVTVTFLPAADSNAQFFSAYLIYSASMASGPFMLVDSITVASQLSKNIASLNANSNSLHLYMINRIYCDGNFYSDHSDTLKTIKLNITSLDPTHSSLAWNEVHTPPLPSSSGMYDIYRSYPVGSWGLLTYTSQLSAYDSLTICNDTIPYQVQIKDNSGCYSISNISGVRYYDNIPPPVPVLDTVSLDSITGFTHISWIANGPETSGYIIFYDNNGNWTWLDTIWGNTETHYIDKTSPGNGCDAYKTYVIAAIDSCWNTSPMSVNDAHNTIKLSIAGIDPCADKITLSWNTYINMKQCLGGYRIYATENGGPPFLLGVNYPAGPCLPVPTTFVHQNFTQDSYYCYYVQAFDDAETKTSTSCRVCILATKPKQPQFIVLRYVTVETNNRIRLNMLVDTSAYITEYRILRAIDKTGPYDMAGTLSPTFSPNMEIIDNAVNPLSQSYYYTVNVVDSCGIEALHSDTARSILLMVESLDNFTNQLYWNDYEGWTWSNVRGYNIYRGIDGLSDPIPIVTLPYGTLTYSDDVSGYFETQGKFRYYIEAVEALGSLPFTDTSYSNRATDVQPSKIYIPNAFSPKGYNSVFKPISIYADKTDYVFIIFNRWGEKLFETRDPNEGWDGTYKGNFVLAGVYIYYVRFNTSKGEKYEKRSTVTIIK